MRRPHHSASLRLFQRINMLPPGHAFKLSREGLVSAAMGEKRSLLFDGRVTEQDLQSFIRQMEANWGVTVDADPSSGVYTICKGKEVIKYQLT